MDIPTHITDLSRTDFEEIARAVNLDATDGVIVDKRADRYVLTIDQNWLKKFIVDNFY